MNRSSIVQVRTNIYRSHSKLLKPVTYTARHLSTPSPRSGLRVAAPKQNKISILSHVRENISLRHHLAYWVHSPHVFGAPIPTLPTIRISTLQRVTSEMFKKTGVASVGPVYSFCFSVSVCLAEYRVWPVFFFNPL